MCDDKRWFKKTIDYGFPEHLFTWHTINEIEWNEINTTTKTQLQLQNVWCACGAPSTQRRTVENYVLTITVCTTIALNRQHFTSYAIITEQFATKKKIFVIVSLFF